VLNQIKSIIIGLLLAVFLSPFLITPVHADMGAGDFQSVCATIDGALYPPCANTPADCKSKLVREKTGSSKPDIYRYPLNCIFLEEPIGGRKGYDLFTRDCGVATKAIKGCQYSFWDGSFIDITVTKKTGPVQAILAYIPGNELYGGMGLLYSYVGLVYNWLSGIIVAFVVLVTIIGGIRMIVSNGDQGEYESGRKMITKALLGMVIWFLSSLILYLLNPTFFSYAT